MRAKRSKRYRKAMTQYGHAFGFREPYQVLVDANFLAAIHAYKMDLVPALERTLHGKVKPMLTRCTLSSILSTPQTPSSTSKPIKTTDPTTNTKTTRPSHLPPPTVLPLRHCPHTPTLAETPCLLSLLSHTTIPSDGSVDELLASRKQKPNRDHYILATAAPLLTPRPTSLSKREEQKLQKVDEEAARESLALRTLTRQIPGVPILYLKRSVLILEPLSEASERVALGTERGKLRSGILATGKRKREEDTQKGVEEGGDGEHGGGERKKKKKEYGFHKTKSVAPAKEKSAKDESRAQGISRAQGDLDDGESIARALPSAGAMDTVIVNRQADEDLEARPKKRRRKHKTKAVSSDTLENNGGIMYEKDDNVSD